MRHIVGINLMVESSAMGHPVHPIYSQIGQTIRTIREDRDITQLDLGLAVGMYRDSIVNLEGGRKTLHVHTLITIAQALNVQPIHLLAGTIPVFVPPIPWNTQRVAQILQIAEDALHTAIKELT